LIVKCQKSKKKTPNLIKPEVRVVCDESLLFFIRERDVRDGGVLHSLGHSAVAGVEPDLQPDGGEESCEGEDEHEKEEEEGDDVAAAGLEKISDVIN